MILFYSIWCCALFVTYLRVFESVFIYACLFVLRLIWCFYVLFCFVFVVFVDLFAGCDLGGLVVCCLLFVLLICLFSVCLLLVFSGRILLRRFGGLLLVSGCVLGEILLISDVKLVVFGGKIVVLNCDFRCVCRCLGLV